MSSLNRKYLLAAILLAALTFISCFQGGLKKEAEIQAENKNSYGEIQGLVTDEDGLPIPGANVFIRKLLLGTNADTLGYYTLHNIPPGKFEVEAIQVGYKKIILLDVEVQADSTTILNISMEVQPMIFPPIIIDPNRK